MKDPLKALFGKPDYSRIVLRSVSVVLLNHATVQH